MVHIVTPNGDGGLPYRNSAGVCLFNKEGKVLIAERSDNPTHWQLPQGGIQVGEDPDRAVFREMKEEIGTDNAKIIGEVPERLRYEFPDYVPERHKMFKGKYRGQEQVWFAMLFLGDDSEINLDSSLDPEPAEFIAWRWADLSEIVDLIVEFKRDNYTRVTECFTPLIAQIKSGEIY